MSAPRTPRFLLVRWALALLRWALALLILFEEWGWEPLSRALARLGRLPVLRQIEPLVRRLPPYAALALFLLPGLALLPIKLGALWLIAHQHAGAGVALIAAAKLAGTAVVARLFELTRPALLRLAWFARLHARWTRWKDRLLAQVRQSAPWRSARYLKLRVKRWLRARWPGHRSPAREGANERLSE